MKQIIAMHGWCCDGNTWEGWETEFASHGWSWKSGERGYGTMSPINPDWDRNHSAEFKSKRVLICHSLGTHLISSKVLKETTDIVFLNSFSRFIPLNDQKRVVKAGLMGMQKHFNKPTERKMLISFLEKASRPHASLKMTKGIVGEGLSPQGRDKLISDFELLVQTNSLPNGIPTKVKALVVNGDEDKIITPTTRNQLLYDLTKHLNTPPVHWIIKGEGHLIQLPKLIKDIRQWLEV